LVILVLFFVVYFTDEVSLFATELGQQGMIISGLSMNLVGLALGLWDSSIFSKNEGEGQ
jgi:hypothetical protein